MVFFCFKCHLDDVIIQGIDVFIFLKYCFFFLCVKYLNSTLTVGKQFV